MTAWTSDVMLFDFSEFSNGNHQLRLVNNQIKVYKGTSLTLLPRSNKLNGLYSIDANWHEILKI